MTAANLNVAIRDEEGFTIFSADKCTMVDSLIATTEESIIHQGQGNKLIVSTVEVQGPIRRTYKVDKWNMSANLQGRYSMSIITSDEVQGVHLGRGTPAAGFVPVAPPAQKKKCSCTMRTLMMRGCQCGGQ
jgi:hypothetical protein